MTQLEERVRFFIEQMRKAYDSDTTDPLCTTAEFQLGWNICARRMLHDFSDFDPKSPDYRYGDA